MIHQLRIYCTAADRRTARSEDYEIFEHNKAAFHARFRDHAIRIMRAHGFEFVALWEATTDERTEFIYLLTWPDVATKEAAWSKFRADEEWKEIKRVTYAEHGDLVGEIEDRVLTATAYSPRASIGAAR